MRDTRREIMDVAKRLFNVSGYNNVSTRDIADELGISKGNLTYYFNKKEDIIEAILRETPSTRITEAPQTLGELNAFFADIEHTVRENAFYFWHHAQLAQISPAIEQMQGEVFTESAALLARSFQVFIRNGLLRREAYSGEYGRVIDTLLLAGVYWTPLCKLKNTSGEAFVKQAWSIVFPYLTEAGKRELDGICSLAK